MANWTGPPIGFWRPEALTTNGALDYIHVSRTISIHYAITKGHKQCLDAGKCICSDAYHVSLVI